MLGGRSGGGAPLTSVPLPHWARKPLWSLPRDARPCPRGWWGDGGSGKWGSWLTQSKPSLAAPKSCCRGVGRGTAPWLLRPGPSGRPAARGAPGWTSVTDGWTDGRTGGMEVAGGGGATTVHRATWSLVPTLGGAPGQAPLLLCLPGDGESPSCGLEVHGDMDIGGQSYSRAAPPAPGRRAVRQVVRTARGAGGSTVELPPLRLWWRIGGGG